MVKNSFASYDAHSRIDSWLYREHRGWLTCAYVVCICYHRWHECVIVTARRGMFVENYCTIFKWWLLLLSSYGWDSTAEQSINMRINDRLQLYLREFSKHQQIPTKVFNVFNNECDISVTVVIITSLHHDNTFSTQNMSEGKFIRTNAQHIRNRNIEFAANFSVLFPPTPQIYLQNKNSSYYILHASEYIVQQ